MEYTTLRLPISENIYKAQARRQPDLKDYYLPRPGERLAVVTLDCSNNCQLAPQLLEDWDARVCFQVYRMKRQVAAAILTGFEKGLIPNYTTEEQMSKGLRSFDIRKHIIQKHHSDIKLPTVYIIRAPSPVESTTRKDVVAWKEEVTCRPQIFIPGHGYAGGQCGSLKIPAATVDKTHYSQHMITHKAIVKDGKAFFAPPLPVLEQVQLGLFGRNGTILSESDHRFKTAVSCFAQSKWSCSIRELKAIARWLKAADWPRPEVANWSSPRGYAIDYYFALLDLAVVQFLSGQGESGLWTVNEAAKHYYRNIGAYQPDTQHKRMHNALLEILTNRRIFVTSNASPCEFFQKPIISTDKQKSSGVPVKPRKSAQPPTTANPLTQPARASGAKGKSGAPMVLVPAGRFMRGSNSGSKDERPQRSIYLKAYYIDKHEVTVGQYRKCVIAGACSGPVAGGYCNWGKSGRDNHPINCVNWHQANKYCKWAGKRLPTESEWEKAARGTDGRQYPWGNKQATCQRAVMDDGGDGCGKDRTWPVGSKSPAGDSPYGPQDMAGNVWEWVSDWYAKDYYASSPLQDPRGPSSGSRRVLRGGSKGSHPTDLRAAVRYGFTPASGSFVDGFRCSRSLP